jgi:hypothetical protein
LKIIVSGFSFSQHRWPMKTHRLLPTFLALLLTGCASNHPMMGARCGTGFSPTRTDKIALTLRPNPSTKDAELGRVLTAELKREGFNLVPQAEADYTLSYAVEDDSTETYVPQRDFVVATPRQTAQELAASATPPPPGFSRPPPGFTPASFIGPTVVVYHNKGIRLYLYTNPKTHPGGLEMAWSGCIEAGDRVSAKREPLLIEALLTHFGQDYIGSVNLNK